MPAGMHQGPDGPTEVALQLRRRFRYLLVDELSANISPCRKPSFNASVVAARLLMLRKIPARLNREIYSLVGRCQAKHLWLPPGRPPDYLGGSDALLPVTPQGDQSAAEKRHRPQ